MAGSRIPGAAPRQVPRRLAAGFLRNAGEFLNQLYAHSRDRRVDAFHSSGFSQHSAPDRVAGPEAQEVYGIHSLREILNALAGANPGMAGDPRFPWPHRLAAQ